MLVYVLREWQELVAAKSGCVAREREQSLEAERSNGRRLGLLKYRL